MAASAFVHSKLSKVFLGTAGAPTTTQDVSDSCDECAFPEELDLVETTPFGSTSKTYLVGFADGKVSVGGSWNRTFHGQMSALKTAFRDGTINSVALEYAPEGNDSGDTKITCNVVLVSYEKSSAVKDQVKWSAEFQITGPVTETAY